MGSDSSLTVLKLHLFHGYIIGKNRNSKVHGQILVMKLCFGQQWVCSGAGWNWLCTTWGQPLVSSHRVHPRSLLSTKTLEQKPNTRSHYCVDNILNVNKTPGKPGRFSRVILVV